MLNKNYFKTKTNYLETISASTATHRNDNHSSFNIFSIPSKPSRFHHRTNWWTNYFQPVNLAPTFLKVHIFAIVYNVQPAYEMR